MQNKIIKSDLEFKSAMILFGAFIDKRKKGKENKRKLCY